MKTPPTQLGLEEFNTLSELGKYSKVGSSDFQQKVSGFFWKLITEADQYKANLIENCITKFADMVKIWPLEKKMPFFNELTAQVKSTTNSSNAVLKLFERLMDDEDNRSSPYSKGTTGGTKIYSTMQGASGSTIYSKSFQEESIYNFDKEPQNADIEEEKDK